MENNTVEKSNNRKKPLYKKVNFYLGLLIIAIVIIGGIKWYSGTLGFISTDDAFIDADRLELGAKILGRIVDLRFAEGDTVEAGMLVAELDSTDIIARLNQAKTALENAKVNVALSQVHLDKAQLDFNRASAQLSNKVIPQAEFDNAQNKLAASQAELKIALSKVTASQAEINVIQTQLDNTKIYTSLGGVIAKKWTLVGDIVQPGQPIYSIYNVKNIWVTAEIEETKIHALSLGDQVEIDVDAYPNHIFTGKIYQIGSNTAAQFALIPPSNASGNFTKVTQRIPVKITIQNDSDKPLKFGLLPGMSVEVKIKVADNG